MSLLPLAGMSMKKRGDVVSVLGGHSTSSAHCVLPKVIVVISPPRAGGAYVPTKTVGTSAPPEAKE